MTTELSRTLQSPVADTGPDDTAAPRDARKPEDSGEPDAGGNPDEGQRLRRLYAGRFDAEEDFRVAMWSVLCREFFSRYIRPEHTVLEVASGHCEFINQIPARERIAVDLNPDVARFAGPGVQVIVGNAADLGEVASGSVDVVFISNFFEHVPREVILATLAEARRVLRRATGRLLVLQPNIRFCARDYWMFFDHITALDDRSLTEALQLSGFVVDQMIVRFLPYTTKGRMPKSLALLRTYLRVPALWRLFGAQSLAVAHPE